VFIVRSVPNWKWFKLQEVAGGCYCCPLNIYIVLGLF